MVLEVDLSCGILSDVHTKNCADRGTSSLEFCDDAAIVGCGLSKDVGKLEGDLMLAYFRRTWTAGV